uniref:Uncharacterized protein n=1 Tax=Arachis duranensis TaxID=130453 RepID=N1NEU6_ARADU|nr:hypothetical protein ARAX_ADH18B08-018 [Arachis duranensis]
MDNVPFNSAYVTLAVHSRSQARIKEEGCVRSSATNGQKDKKTQKKIPQQQQQKNDDKEKTVKKKEENEVEEKRKKEDEEKEDALCVNEHEKKKKHGKEEEEVEEKEKCVATGVQVMGGTTSTVCNGLVLGSAQMIGGADLTKKKRKKKMKKGNKKTNVRGANIEGAFFKVKKF